MLISSAYAQVPSFAASTADRGWFEDLIAYTLTGFLWEGALVAVQITLLAMTIGLALGLLLALMRLSRNVITRGVSWFYIWVVRGTPQLLQLVFIFDALPFIGLKFNSFTTAVIGFSLNQAAFSAEVIRGGIVSVSRSQTLAAASLGMSSWLTLRRIVLPQAMRGIVPGIGNDTINMLKLTAIASVIFVQELTFRAQQIVGHNFKFFTVFAAAGLMYLVMTSAVGAAQSWAEDYYSLDRKRRPKGSAMRRMFGFGAGAEADAVLAEPAKPAVTAAEPVALPPQVDWLRAFCSGDTNGMAKGDSFVVARGVHKHYDGRQVLCGIDLTVRLGEVVVLLGPSGSGKSTMLRMINHLEAMDGGEITVGGRHVGYEKTAAGLKPSRKVAASRAEARIGMVFQHFNLFEHLTALENITEAPIRVFGVAPEAARERAMRLLTEVGLATHADKLPHQLSGGQQQRVAIARALAISPRLMLFDEPTSALDPELVGEVLKVMRRLAQAGMTMVIVTHEIQFARDVADRVIVMDEGAILEQGTPQQVLDAPQRERTRRFLRAVTDDRGEAAD